MANLHRGEIAAFIGGAERRLRLTLGALAELEDAFGAEDLADLARRFASGSLKTRDVIRVIAAGLRGAGEMLSDDDVAKLPVEGGIAGYADTVVRLIAATFGGEEETRPLDRPAPDAAPSPGTTSSPSASAS